MPHPWFLPSKSLYVTFISSTLPILTSIICPWLVCSTASIPPTLLPLSSSTFSLYLQRMKRFWAPVCAHYNYMKPKIIAVTEICFKFMPHTQSRLFISTVSLWYAGSYFSIGGQKSKTKGHISTMPFLEALCCICYLSCLIKNMGLITCDSWCMSSQLSPV